MKRVNKPKTLKSQDLQKSQTWTFFTNHTHVLVYLAMHGSAPLKDVASAIGITERAAQRIVKELEESGVLSHQKAGRNNIYTLNMEVALRHPLEKHCTIGQILAVILRGSKKKPA
jgi:DNA-binding Lrp family transcriptional regulator